MVIGFLHASRTVGTGAGGIVLLQGRLNLRLLCRRRRALFRSRCPGIGSGVSADSGLRTVGTVFPTAGFGFGLVVRTFPVRTDIVRPQMPHPVGKIQFREISVVNLKIFGEHQPRAISKRQGKVVSLARGGHIGELEAQFNITDFFAGQGHVLRGPRLVQHAHGNPHLHRTGRPQSGLPDMTDDDATSGGTGPQGVVGQYGTSRFGGVAAAPNPELKHPEPALETPSPLGGFQQKIGEKAASHATLRDCAAFYKNLSCFKPEDKNCVLKTRQGRRPSYRFRPSFSAPTWPGSLQQPRAIRK